MLKVYGHILNIDDLGNRIFSKILFAFLFVVEVMSLLNPLGDNDFSAMYRWSRKMLSDTDLLMEATVADIPMTTGNVVFIFFTLFINLLLILGAMLYCGVYVREYRKGLSKLKPGLRIKIISIPSLIGRLLLLCISMVIFFFPLVILVLYLPLIFIIIFPCLLVYVACFLSGDKDFFGGIVEAFKRTKGFYMIIARDLSSFMLCYFLLDYLLAFIGNAVPIVSYVVAPFLMVYVFLVVGRYAGFIYCRIIETPIIAFRRPDIKR